MDAYQKNRSFLKSTLWKDFHLFPSDQKKGLQEPPRQKPIVNSTEFVELTDPKYIKLGQLPTRDAIARRKSRRVFSEQSLTLEELSYLLWATQGMREDGPRQFRNVPSAGARHPFDTYLFVQRVEALTKGFYRYLPLEHKLAFAFERTDAPLRLIDACFGQKSVGESAITFIWTAIPYRTEWRYHATAYKVIALDAGHLCQNLYLACESIGVGTCALAAYDQDKMDILMGVDGEDEFVIYMAAVGKI